MPPEVENRSRNRRLPHRPADTAQPHLFKRFQTGLVRAQETAGTHVHQRIAAARFNGVHPGKRSEDSGGGKECISTVISLWAQFDYKKNSKTTTSEINKKS